MIMTQIPYQMYKRRKLERVKASSSQVVAVQSVEAKECWSGAIIFGDEAACDITLVIPGPEDAPQDGYKIQATRGKLVRAGYFAGLFKDEWNHVATSEYIVELAPAKIKQEFIAVIKLLYLDDLGTHFTSVKNALEHFEMATAICFEEYITTCISYLERVPWSPQELFAVHEKFTTTPVPASSDLRARLDCSGVDWAEELSQCISALVDKEVEWTLWTESKRMGANARNLIIACCSEYQSLEADDPCDDTSSLLLHASHRSSLLLRRAAGDASRSPRFVHLIAEKEFLRSFTSAWERVSAAAVNQGGDYKETERYARAAMDALESLLRWGFRDGITAALQTLSVATHVAARFAVGFNPSPPAQPHSRYNRMQESARRVVAMVLKALKDGAVHLPLETRQGLATLWFPVLNKLEETRYVGESVLDIGKLLPAFFSTLPVKDQARHIFRTINEGLESADNGFGPFTCSSLPPYLPKCLSYLCEVANLQHADVHHDVAP